MKWALFFSGIVLGLLAFINTAGAEHIIIGNGSGIARYDLSDGTGTTLATHASNKHLANIAVDSVNGRVYWQEEWNNYLNRFNYYDLSAGTTTQVYEWQDGGSLSTTHLDVDGVLGKSAIQTSDRAQLSQYWTRYTYIDVRNLGSFSSTNIYQAPRAHISHWQGIVNPRPVWVYDYEVEDVAIDPISQKVYWADSVDGAIRRRNIDGNGPVETLYTGLDKPEHVVLDAGAGTLYFSEMGGASAVVSNANMSGGGSPTTLMTGFTSLTDIAVDPISGYIYYCDNNALYRADYNGTNSQAMLNSGGGQISASLVVMDLLAGSGPGNPLTGALSGYDLQFSGVDLPASGAMLFFAAEYNEGLDFNVSGSDVSSILLPDTGDGLYDLYAWNSSGFSFLQQVAGGDIYTFAPGVTRFMLQGLETGAGLSPEDPDQFVPGITFSSSASADMTVSLVPEPTTIGLLALGGLVILRKRRSK